MEIILLSISDKGDINNERIGFKVLKDCDLKYYLLFKSIKTSGGFQNRSSDAYWFLPQEVKAGDRVVLYSKSGTASITKNKDGSNTYFFYWKRSECVFINDNDKFVLVSIKDWRLLP